MHEHENLADLMLLATVLAHQRHLGLEANLVQFLMELFIIKHISVFSYLGALIGGGFFLSPFGDGPPPFHWSPCVVTKA